MPTAHLHRWLIAILAALTLQACATGAKPGDAPFQISEDYANNVIRYTVQRGDRLSDIALEFTGNVNAWLPIAEHNGITDPKAMRVGSKIEIPTTLIPGYEEERLIRRAQLRDSSAADSVRVTQAVTAEVSDEQRADVPTTINESNQTATSDPSQEPGTETQLISTEQELQLQPQVRVVGSYYPKGVYAQPTLDSQLMMRAAPGDDFELIEQLNSWYRIETDRGQGFIRARDGRIIDVER